MPELPKIPTWEASKEIADKLPGGKGQQDAKCPECGADMEKDPRAQRDRKGR